MTRRCDALTIHEAARRLGVSERTIRRYVKAGRLHAALVDSRYGPTIDIAPDAIAAEREAAHLVEAPAAALVSAMREALADRDRETAAALDALRAEVVQLRAEIHDVRRRRWWPPWARR